MPRQLSRRRSVNPEPEDTEEDEVEETRPARRRRSRDEDDERDGFRESQRQRRRSSRDDAEEAPEDYDDEEDERPARKRQFRGKADADAREARKSKRPASAGSSSLRSGWGDGKMKSSGRNFSEERFTIEEDTSYVFKFAEEAPIVSFNEHFCEDLPKGTRKSYVCLEDGCPLCQLADEIGDNKMFGLGFRRVFNVIVFDKRGNPKVKYWVATPAPLGEIENFAFDEEWVSKHGPLNNPNTYFTISKSRPKKGGPFKFRLDHVRARDLEEDHGIVPLTEDELEELEDDFFTKKDVVKEDDIETLEEIAEELS